jgi:hypothetical protein
MNYIAFRERFHAFACFSHEQVMAAFPRFDRGNYASWLDKGYIRRLRRSWYAFDDAADTPGIGDYFAGKIYSPSYLSCEYVMARTGLIPESVVQFTSVTSLKTASFKNDFGEFSYRTVKSHLMFGYEVETVGAGLPVQIATPAKALCDFLYLNPQYDTPDELEALRFDPDVLEGICHGGRLDEVVARFGSRALSQRIKLVKEVYAI